MSKTFSNNRRRFLRNISLASITAAVYPLTGTAMAAGSNPDSSQAACDPTTLDFYGEGPFYTANAPSLSNNQLAASNEPGDRMIISGRVMNLDCTEAIPGATIDVWHADDAGTYDNVGYKLRGKTTSNAQGFYLFETIKPGKYLNGSMYRPSHIHFKVTAPGFSTLTTQLYFQGDTDIPADAAASITSGTYDASARIIPLTTNSSGVLEGTWDIVVNADGIPLGAEDLHLEKGMIYGANPQPFNDEIEIQYGVFRRSKVNVVVFDMNGRRVAQLDENVMEPEKYAVTWRPPSELPAGYYFVTLQVNDVQVHHYKVVKQ